MAKAFLESLAAKSVRYLIVGGEAVILHGHVRLTGDVDFWGGEVPGNEFADGLALEGLVVGQPPNRIDLVNVSTGSPSRNERASGRPKDLDDVAYLTRGD